MLYLKRSTHKVSLHLWLPSDLCVVLFHLNISFPPRLFLIVKHAETQSSAADLTTDIDKGKSFCKTVLCVEQTIIRLWQLLWSWVFGNRGY